MYATGREQSLAYVRIGHYGLTLKFVVKRDALPSPSLLAEVLNRHHIICNTLALPAAGSRALLPLLCRPNRPTHLYLTHCNARGTFTFVDGCPLIDSLIPHLPAQAFATSSCPCWSVHLPCCGSIQMRITLLRNLGLRGWATVLLHLAFCSCPLQRLAPIVTCSLLAVLAMTCLTVVREPTLCERHNRCEVASLILPGRVTLAHRSTALRTGCHSAAFSATIA